MAEAVPASASRPENVAHDDLCPICQLLLFTPVKTQCNHLLCASCMAQWAEASSSNKVTEIEHSSADVDLANFDPNYDPTYDLEANCPMCRSHTTASPDTELAKQLETKYPTTYTERRVEEEIERGSRVGQNGIEGFLILIGNKHKLISESEDANEHDWTFFVRTSRPDIVKEVRLDLHPTFRPSQVTIRRPPFEVNRLGWGTFTLEATIVLQESHVWVSNNGGARKSDLELTWTLDFNGEGRQGRVRAKVKKVEEVLTDRERRLRARQQPVAVAAPSVDDEDDEADDDYEEQDDDEDMLSSESDEDEDEEASEFVETPRR